MRAVIYARISTNEEKQNIKQQVEYCKKRAIQEGYVVEKVFKDIKTGKSDNRRGYIRLKEYLKNNPGITLIVQDSDRLTRSFYEGVELEKLIIKQKITLFSLSESINLKNANGRFMFRIRLAMNNFYVENLNDKIRIGVERAKKQGKFKGRKKGSKNKKKKI
jgi:DNA invertase Pin-like site-specific DNA recombinase